MFSRLSGGPFHVIEAGSINGFKFLFIVFKFLYTLLTTKKPALHTCKKNYTNGCKKTIILNIYG